MKYYGWSTTKTPMAGTPMTRPATDATKNATRWPAWRRVAVNRLALYPETGFAKRCFLNHHQSIPCEACEVWISAFSRGRKQECMNCWDFQCSLLLKPRFGCLKTHGWWAWLKLWVSDSVSACFELQGLDTFLWAKTWRKMMFHQR